MNAVDSTTTVRPYHDGDEQALVELFGRVFGSPITLDHWRWKLRANPAPVENVWLAVAGERPVFQYAGIPQRYRISGQELLGMVSVDTMTHPDFRRRGLLTRVATEAYAAWREAGASFVFGLPNQQWGSRTTALGWQELFTLQWLARPLRPEAIAARRLKMPWLMRQRWVATPWNRYHQRHWHRDAALEITAIDAADASFDEFWKHIENRHPFSAVRDRAWVEWRFLKSPQRRYEVLAARSAGKLAGYLAYRLVELPGRTTALMAELIAARDDYGTRDQLLGEFVVRMLAAGVESVITLAVTGGAEWRWLRRRGFLRSAGFSVQLVPLAPGLPLDAMKRPSNWLLSGADFDVI